MAINPFRFQPLLLSTTFTSRSVLDLLPGVNRTNTIQNFFTSSINHLFQPGKSDVLDGYIGEIPNWNDNTTDHYISEPDAERRFYQLAPVMVSKNADTNSYTNVLFYTDLINQLGFQGARTDNHSRLFDEKFYTWCPYIDLDKIINYRKYWWMPSQSSYPDYLTISTKSRDANPWSKTNSWIHESDLDDSKKKVAIQAARPIIEFLPNIELFNYGRYRRQDTDYIIFDQIDVQSITGTSQVTLDGDTYYANSLPSEGIRFLVIHDKDTNFNNKVYGLNNLNGSFLVTTESDGQDPYGSPVLGEITQIKKGSHSLEEYWFNGTEWVLAQSKQNVNQFPLFRLYDTNGHSLDDQVEYPNTDFKGGRVFSYNVGTDTDVTDSVLGFPLTRDMNGQIQFKDYISQDVFHYRIGLDTFEIKGYYFLNIMADDATNDILSNHWWESPYTSRQMVVDNFVANGVNKSFKLSQTPDDTTDVRTPNIIVTVSTKGTDGVTDIVTNNLKEGTDYLRDKNFIIINDLNKGDSVKVKTYSSKANTGDGFYEVPVNLVSNPTNQPINLVSIGDVYAQFSQIIQGQSGFSGQVSNLNNWHTLDSYDLTLGTKIIQNASSLLPLMLTCSDTNLDIGDAIRFVSDEYMTFKSKFESKITEFYTKGTFPARADMTDLWINNALDEITKGMTYQSPFYNSQMGVTNGHPSYFIPPTPAFLGMAQIYKPEISPDFTIPTTPDVIYGHDGSTTICYGDFRDQVILELETRIYNSIPNQIRNRTVPSLKLDDWISTPSFEGQYSRQEYLTMIQSEFDRFTLQVDMPKFNNTTYDVGNPFSYNWSTVQSNITGEKLPGSWRAIYNLYYGTDRPHTHPWEMFGFSAKPSWWDARYGQNFDANDTTHQNYYTSDNRILWNDVRDGYIAQGDLKGYHKKYARPSIYSMIPVDEQGYLLDPYQSGIAKNYPDANDANQDWNFGDQGSAETVWMRSSAYQFAKLLTLYLMKPSRFISTFWDTLDYSIIQNGTISEQQINTLLGRRDLFPSLLVHGEKDKNGQFVQRYGIQQFISDRLVNSNKSVTKLLGNTVRGLDVRLGHKMAGFTDSPDNTIITDTNDIIPTTNVTTLLYTSPSIKNTFYSGVIISRNENGWKVYGFDNFDPEFRVIYPNTQMASESLSVGSVKSNLVHKWKSNTYYPKGMVVRTDDGTFYLCTKNHTSGLSFEPEYWVETERQEYSLKESVAWYLQGNDQNEVTTVPYGTIFYTAQDVVNFLNGLQRKQEADGWKFTGIANDGSIEDWSKSALQFLNWKSKVTDIGAFISLSPLANSATFKTEKGEIQNLERIVNGQYGIVDKSGLSIEPYDVSVEREDGKVTLTPTNSQTLFGVKLYVNTIEHVLVFDNATIFGDVIYNPVMNVYQPRLKIQGYRTQNWNGRLSAPGFVISGNKLIPNFEKTADDFRHYFDVESLDNDSLQKRARANIGFKERSYMTNLAIGPTNQFEFYQGMIQDKGTPSVFRKIMRSNIIRGSNGISYHEEWAFRIGSYGADDIRPSVVFDISHDEIKNDPQLIEFDIQEVHDEGTYQNDFWLSNDQTGTISLTNQAVKSIYISDIEIASANMKGTYSLSYDGKTGKEELVKNFDLSRGSIQFKFDNPIQIFSQNIYFDAKIQTGGKVNLKMTFKISNDSFATNSTSSNTIVINDVKSLDTGKFIVKDKRWVQRFGINEVKWPTQNYPQVSPGFFPNAGYVNVDTVKWTAPKAIDFYSLYHDTEMNHDPINFTSSYQFVKKGSSSRVVTANLIKSQQSGWFRVNRITVTINKSPMVGTVLNIGTSNQLPDGWNNNYSSSLIERFTSEDLTSAKGSITRYPSAFWNLDGQDNTIKVQVVTDDTSNIPASLTLADLEIEIDVDWVTDSILPNDRTWVYDLGIGDWGTFSLKDTGFKIDQVEPSSFDGQGSVVSLKGYDLNPQNILTESSLLVMSGIQGISPEVTTILKPKFSNSISAIVDGSSDTVPLLKFVPDAGMKIDNLSINVLKPFSTSDGSDIDVDIGTEKNKDLLTQSSVLSNPVPTKPDFSADTQVTVKLANPTITISNDSQDVEIHIVRYGNIYGIPQGCGNLPITKVNWEYSPVDQNTGQPTNWQYGGTVEFGNPQNQSDIKETYWHVVGDFQFQKNSGLFMIRLTNAQNALIDQINNSTKITPEAEATSTTFNPTKVGNQPVNTDLFNLNNDHNDLQVTVGKNTNGLAIVTISYSYTNGFELVTIDDTPFIITDTGHGGNVLTWLSTRYKNRSEASQSQQFNQLPDGTWIELDNDNWEIGKKQGSSIATVWFKNEKVISSQLESAIVYNKNTGELEEPLEVFDPYKGFIPKIATEELEYILEYDPAVYNYTQNGPAYTNNATWGREEVGLLWWDISTARYLDYESFDLGYKWKNWGKLCPGVEIDIYEWTRSPVPPTAWNNYVSTAKDQSSTSSGFPSNPSGTVESNISWVQELEWDTTTQKEITAYYFWVKLPTTVPAIPERSKSATSTAEIIKNPMDNGISYYAVIDQNHVIVGNIKEFITNTTSLKLKWNIGTNEGNFHKQWLLLREGDDTAQVDSSLWRKMSDSLTGFDSTQAVYEVTGTTNEDVRVGTNDISITNKSGDTANLPVIGEIKIGELWFTYSGKIGNKFYGIKNDYGYDIKQGANVYIRSVRGNPNQVPDPTLSLTEALGALNRPLQSWFAVENGVSSRTARHVFVDIMNNIFSTAPFVEDWYNWSDLLESSEKEPNSSLYNFEAPDFLYRNQLVSNGLVQEGNTVLVPGQIDTDGFWTVWQYSPSHPRSDANGYVLIDAQKWRLQAGEFWDYVDWYASGWGPNQYPMYHFDTVTERNNANINVTLLNGTLVEVANKDQDNPRWVRYVYNSNGWTVVGREKATFKLSDQFYTSTKLYGYGSYDLSIIKTRDGTKELRWLLDHMMQVMSNSQILTVFLTMTRYAIASDPSIDWVFKTSYMYLGGYTEQMTQNPVSYVNQMPNITYYIEEVKPYHTKIRDYISTYSAGPDIAQVHVTDFDFPVYQDPTNSSTPPRLLSPVVKDGVAMENPSGSNSPMVDSSIVSNNFPWADWYNNYSLESHDRENWTPKRNPVRSFDIHVILDRVKCSPSIGWDPLDIPWDSPLTIFHGNDNGASDEWLFNNYRTESPTQYQDIVTYKTTDNPATASKNGTVLYSLQDDKNYMWVDGNWIEFNSLKWDMDTEGGCASRINQFYEPTYDMTPKDLTCLLDGCDFRGTKVKGGPIEAGAWDMFAWDPEAGWANEFAYYDGGQDYTSTIDIHKNTQIDGHHPALDMDVTGRDFDVESIEIREDLPPDGVQVFGDDLVQPEFADNHPEERVPTEGLSSLLMVITDANKKFSIIFGNDSSWNYSYLNDDSTKVEQDNGAFITVKCPNGLNLHDPANPTDQFLEKVKASFVNLNIPEADRKKLLSRLMPGSLLVETSKDGKNSYERIQYWDVTNNNDGTWTLGALQRNYTGIALRPGTSYSNTNPVIDQDSTVYDISVVNWITPLNHKMKIDPLPSPDIQYKRATRNGNKVWKLGDIVMAPRD